jgi:hypothetical protein
MKALGVAADVYYSKDKQGQFDTKYEQQAYAAQQTQPVQAPAAVDPNAVMAEISSAMTEEALKAIYYKYPMYQSDANFTGALTARKDQIKKNGKS